MEEERKRNHELRRMKNRDQELVLVERDAKRPLKELIHGHIDKVSFVLSDKSLRSKLTSSQLFQSFIQLQYNSSGNLTSNQIDRPDPLPDVTIETLNSYVNMLSGTSSNASRLKNRYQIRQNSDTISEELSVGQELKSRENLGQSSSSKSKSLY